MHYMDINSKLFLKINSPVGKSKLLDNFGRAGAEWMFIGMVGWYFTSALVNGLPDKSKAFLPLGFLCGAWLVGWLINLGLALAVREPRPFITYPQIKTLFRPLMSWRSFPSDHSMAVFTIVFNAYLFHLPSAWALVPMALWVVWGRMFAGVHYPLDILGGFGVAGFVATITSYILIILK